VADNAASWKPATSRGTPKLLISRSGAMYSAFLPPETVAAAAQMAVVLATAVAILMSLMAASRWSI